MRPALLVLLLIGSPAFAADPAPTGAGAERPVPTTPAPLGGQSTAATGCTCGGQGACCEMAAKYPNPARKSGCGCGARKAAPASPTQQ